MLWLILVAVIPITTCQRTDTWDSCGCNWLTWQAWSNCSSRCYGGQIRERLVNVLDTPECGTFESCDGGNGASERRDCNKHCDTGHYNGYGCSCPLGRYGECCDSILTCAKPVSIPHGKVHGGRFQYNDVITYTCDTSFNLTGPYERTCMVNGGWSLSTPRCIFAESCRSGPCQNGGTCVDGLDRYDCICGSGWTGKNCDVHVDDDHPARDSAAEDSPNTTLVIVLSTVSALVLIAVVIVVVCRVKGTKTRRSSSAVWPKKNQADSSSPPAYTPGHILGDTLNTGAACSSMSPQTPQSPPDSSMSPGNIPQQSDVTTE
ncbi:neurogenic locus notch homolog protein 1-like [Haliotis rubra]|uniref:neurogenic locus notch homolog protein 1-like n=1 Tax=Haliotis rubra TaxID=36100 RepID=UPI001EE5274C|nr:neurogenic locus notch homolog protein 1-like [Haliotis rubra]